MKTIDALYGVIRHGMPIPPKVWFRATDVASEYARSGEAWVAAGRPSAGHVHDRFIATESEYDRVADAVWFAKWEDWQRDEWATIFRERGV